MKKTIALLLCFCFVCCLSVTAFAQTLSEGKSESAAEITTVVPDSHKVNITADGAEVFFEGNAVTEFAAGRLTEPKILIRANSGKILKQVLINGDDITSHIKGGYYTFSPVYEDKELTVITEDETPVVQTGTYTVRGTVKLNGQPVSGITLELHSKIKTSVTDDEGKVCFSDVECGKHSLTAIKDGKVVGHIEFVLSDSTSANFGLQSNGIYAVTLDRNEIGIDLMMNLSNDGIFEIESVSGIIKDEEPSPKTGDGGNIALWVTLLFVSSGAAVGITVVSKKKNHKR